MLPIIYRDILSKREVKKVGFSIAIGIILAIISSFIIGYEKSEIGLLVCFIGIGIAYFIFGNRLFKK